MVTSMNLDAYKKRLEGRNTAEAMEIDTAKLVKRMFKDSKAYNKAILIDYNLNETPIDIRMVNIDKSVYNKKFYLIPGQVAKVGNYIKIKGDEEDEYWLITEYEKNAISHCAHVTYCNQRINFVNGTFLPCVASGESYGVLNNAPIYSNIYKKNNLNCWKLLKLIKPQRKVKS